MNIAIAGYKSLERICESTNTSIYRAYKEDQTAIVIKTLKAEYPSIEDFTYLKHEYKILQNLEIKGLIKPFALENYQNGLALLCADLTGVSLKKTIAERKIELNKFLPIAVQLVTIITQLHQNYIIHKDIQPGNILIDAQTGEVNIIDVSLSSCLFSEHRAVQNFNLLKGNLAYMSPEQTGRMNRSVDYRTDFYSLGVTFYEMLTGQLPFQTSNPLELIHCHIAKAALPPREIDPEIPSVLSDIVMKLLAKTAEDRYQSALGLKADLENCLKILQTTGESHFTVGQIDLCSQFLIPQKLYGREREVATLLATFERVSRGATEIVLVSGYSGIGKSSLVNEVHKPIVGARGYFISGEFDQFKRNIPYAALIQAFQELIRQLLTESSEAIAIWRAKLKAALGANGQIIIDVIPEVEKIIGSQPAVPSLRATESQNRFNRVFQQFIRVFTQLEHPLVIFLDDLQWADLASLKLIQLLACNSDTQYLLLIGAYRDNEVRTSHPLILTLEEMQQTGATVNNIVLQPLQLKHVKRLASDTLHSDMLKIEPLADLVFHKTEGNPFFLTQLLKSLYQENLLFFNFDRGCWQWEMQRLQNIEIAENVVELMVDRIQKLSAKTQNVLKFAACIGDKFTLDLLAIVNEKSALETATELWEALQAGLILPLSEAYKIPLVLDSDTSTLQVESLKVEYKFLHDRVQQAAYSLIPDSQKKATHLKIGQLLLENTPLEERKENIFALVNQLNYGIDLLALELEKYEIAELNLIAGQRAKAATAYESAMRYLKVGLELLAANSWHQQYELSIALHQEAAEVAFLIGDFEQMEQLAEVVLQQAKTQLDKVKIYELQIKTCEVQRKLLEAVKLGLQALEILGVKLPESPTSIDVRQAIDAATANLAEKGIEDLIHLPPMTDANKLAAFQLIASLVPAAYQSAPSLFILMACQQVNLSLSHGNTPLSASGFADYGIVFSGLLEDIETAYQFGQLALNILERLDAREVRSQTLFKVATFVLHWKHHVRETLPLLEDAYSSGLENGDLGHTGYSASHKCQYSYWSGVELKSLEREMASYSRAIAQINQETALKWHQIFHQVVLNLMGLAENPCRLIGEAYNEEQFLPFHIQLNERTVIHYVFLNKLILCYLFGEFAQAGENANKAEQYLDGVRGWLAVPLFYFYDSLAQLAIYPSVPRSQQEFCLTRITNNQEKMRKWADSAPMNFQHKSELVEAEKARVLGQYWQAMECYDRAIAGAKEHGYIQEEALANELAAKFYFSQGKDKIARVYLVESYYGYLRWEATAKVKDLETRYPQVFTQAFEREHPVETNTASSHKSLASLKHLDLATVMKASQALSEEIVFSNLLTKLMQIVLENAGAEKGFLLLEQAGELFVEASGSDTEIAVQRSLPVKMLAIDRPFLPISAIDYVARTHESIVLNDATAEEIFAADPYIIACQPRSILCAPILHQGRLTGILYLENNLTTGAFTPDRLEVLQLLSAQAAISIENARLYNDLEDYNRTLEAKVAERTLELQQEIRVSEASRRDRQRAESAAAAANRAKSQFLANMSHELRTPLNGILGYAQILKQEKTLTEQQKNGLNVIYRCGDHLLTLIEDILDLSKIEAQKMELYPHDFHLPQFLAEIVDICRLRAEQKQISLTYETLSIPEFVRVDEKRLRQVLLNLLGNAIKFTETGGVTFRVSDRAGKLRFQVEDTGIGMAAAQLEEIFLPFQQVGEHYRHTEGTGLGLAISRQLVRMMGCDIQVQSTLEKGSIFWFDLDLDRICHAEVVSVEKVRKIVGFQGDKRQILVVDDRESNRFVLANMLQPLGFEVIEAADGLDCLAKAREFQPDCICMDLVMPGSDGFEATRRIRTMPELAGVVIIAVSASVFDRDRQQSQLVGCDGFLAKPVREADLLEQLRIHLHLEWVYEAEIVTKGANDRLKEEITATAIVSPPAAEMAVLLDLAMMGDIRGIVEQTARIETLNRRWMPFTSHLRQLAQEFKAKQILEFIRKYS